MSDADPERLFVTAVAGLRDIAPVYLHVVEGATPPGAPQLPFDYGKLRALFDGLYIANNGYTLERARRALAGNRADLFSFGRPYIANPDLPERFRAGAALAVPDADFIHDGGPRGYTDYPRLTVPA